MIKFSLRCAEGHDFESWFQSGEAFDGLKTRGLVTCAVCNSKAVEKTLMAPAIANAAGKIGPKSTPSEDVAARIQRLRAEVEANSDYVGDRFASEARAMYLGDTPGRPIHGEAKPDEAKALIEDGVPVLPLPFIPSRKTN